MTTAQEQFDRLFGHVLGHQATEIAATGLRTGLLAAIAERPGLTSAELAAAADLDDRYVAVWARGAFADGLLERTSADCFELAAHVGTLLLDPTSPTYLGGTVRMESSIDEDYRRFPTLMATGQTWPRKEQWRNVLGRTLRALRPGGGVVVVELPYPDDVDSYRSSPVHRRLTGIPLHETAVGCGAITEGQLCHLVAAAGFTDVRLAQQPRGSRYVVIGTKPSPADQWTGPP